MKAFENLHLNDKLWRATEQLSFNFQLTWSYIYFNVTFRKARSVVDSVADAETGRQTNKEPKKKEQRQQLRVACGCLDHKTIRLKD